jgi:hypothetical protein
MAGEDAVFIGPTDAVGGVSVNENAAEKALTVAGNATSTNPTRVTSIPYRWGWRPRAEGTDCGRPFTTVVAFAKTPPLCRWPEYSFPHPDVHRASGRHPTSHRDDFVRLAHFQLVAQLAALSEIHQTFESRDPRGRGRASSPRVDHVGGVDDLGLPVSRRLVAGGGPSGCQRLARWRGRRPPAWRAMRVRFPRRPLRGGQRGWS